MADTHELFPHSVKISAPSLQFSTGILPSQKIEALIGHKKIEGDVPLEDSQIQPASLDLRLGRTAYRVRASFLPGTKSEVRPKIDELCMYTIDLRQGAWLERHCVYVVELLEFLKLDKLDSAIANPKSSAGRLDIFTRLIADYADKFDVLPPGYGGPLYAEISPGTFTIMVRTGTRLNQLRLRRGNPLYYDKTLRDLHETERLIDAVPGEEDIRDGVALTADLVGDGENPIGYRAKKHAGLIDFDKSNHYDPADFWDAIYPSPKGNLILDPGDFYILKSRDAVSVPPNHAAEMRAYDTLVGEFRVHYAGFFDPGFGHADAGGAGSRAVLEIRPHDVPFVLENGQIVGRLLYERLTETPDRLYGPAIGSTYQRQGLMLGKQFKRPPGSTLDG